MTVEGAAGEGIDDFFDFGGDGVAPDKIGVVENGAEEAFSQQMLHEHLVDHIGADLRIK